MTAEVLRELSRMENRLSLLPCPQQRAWRSWAQEVRRKILGESSHLGFAFAPALVAGGAVVVGTVGAWLWSTLQQARARNRYLDCVEKLISRGYSPEEAHKVCNPQAVPPWVGPALIVAGVAITVYVLGRTLR